MLGLQVFRPLDQLLMENIWFFEIFIWLCKVCNGAELFQIEQRKKEFIARDSNVLNIIFVYKNVYFFTYLAKNSFIVFN